MPNALIFSPCLDGHRQVYVFVMVNILEKLGYKTFIAGNLQEKVMNSFYIDKLLEKPEIKFLDTSKYSRGGINITLQEFRKLQNNCQADLTIFTEADFHISLFISQIFSRKDKLSGKVIAIFMRPFYFYQPNPFLDKLRFIKNIFSRWNKDEKVFFEFFLKKFSLVDISFSIDENFVNYHSNFKWLPDIFQQYADSIVKPDEKSAQRVWIEKLKVFKEKNQSRFIFLYFGTSQNRRGYDTLLKLAEKTGGCFVHCGLLDPGVDFYYKTEEIISTLINEERYFQTNEFIEDPITIKYFFESVSHLILPYKDFLGSSGVMLQALEYGIPVLAPETAIIGYRIKKYNLGMTYIDNNFNSLRKQFTIFKNSDPFSYQEEIKAYMKLQSPEQLKNALINSFENTKRPVIVP